jgi:hypothetical protein
MSKLTSSFGYTDKITKALCNKDVYDTRSNFDMIRNTDERCTPSSGASATHSAKVCTHARKPDTALLVDERRIIQLSSVSST